MSHLYWHRGVNALFSGLAFAILIVTLILQKEELSLQRQELQLTRQELEGQRKELQGQKEQLQAQNALYRQQSLENTFFQLLKFHHELVGSMRFSNWEGRDVFEGLHNQMRQWYLNKQHEDALRLLHKNWERTYMHTYSLRDSLLPAYVRRVYNLIHFVDSSDIEGKTLYAKILRDQFTPCELALLCYHGLTNLGDNMKPLVEKYGLLMNLQGDLLMDQALLQKYNSSALGDTICDE